MQASLQKARFGRSGSKMFKPSRYSMLLPVLIVMTAFLTACGKDSSPPDIMRIATQPGGADITVNGQHYGKSPQQAGQALELRLPTGRYHVEAKRSGGELFDLIAAVEVEHSETVSSPVLTIVLERRLTEAGELAQAAEVAAVEERRERMSQRFEVLNNGTVIDAEAGLMWMRCAIGQDWSGHTCVGEGRQLNWDRAFLVADETAFAGYDDWRLPTQPELYALTFCSTGRRSEPSREGLGGGCVGEFEKPTIITTVFPNSPTHSFWTSTRHERLNYSAWGVSFLSGHTGTGGRSDFIYLRLVRDLAP